ncbi:MAG: cytochrome d ubiquinol oxidase subunit II [Gemmatimonadaceae bacterium]
MADLLTLPNVLAAAILVSLQAYVLFGGADFGAGMWDLLARGPRREFQRTLIAKAIGPIWEANHVWFVLAVVVLFSCFPPAFAMLTTELHVPLSLMLVGIVLRGTAFVFRSADERRDAVQRRWGLVFSLSSVFTPLLLGICAGAIASGAVARAAQMTGASFTGRFIVPWTSPFILGVGAFTLALFAFLAAVYLTVEAEGHEPLQEDFRRRALGAAVAVFACAAATLVLSRRYDPGMTHTLVNSPWAVPLQLLTGIAAVGAILALVTRRFRVARLAAGAQVSLIVWGWALDIFPSIIPGALTIMEAASPAGTLRATLIVLAVGAVILLPSLAYLFRIFKSRPSAFERLEDLSADV